MSKLKVGDIYCRNNTIYRIVSVTEEDNTNSYLSNEKTVLEYVRPNEVTGMAEILYSPVSKPWDNFYLEQNSYFFQSSQFLEADPKLILELFSTVSFTTTA